MDDPLGFFIRAMDFCWIFHGPDVFFLAVHGDFCKGKRPLQQRKWMESLSLFECQNAFKETVAFKVPFVSLWLCCFGALFLERNP